MGRERIILTGPEETISFGAQFASKLAVNSILALQGDLGAGKTTFVQGLLNGLNIRDLAQSPTFTYLQIYERAVEPVAKLHGNEKSMILGHVERPGSAWPDLAAGGLPKRAGEKVGSQHGSKGRFFAPKSFAIGSVYHFDLYRLQSERDFLLLGFDEFLFAGGIAVIEWPERIESLLPPDTCLIRLSHHEQNRIAEITTWRKRAI